MSSSFSFFVQYHDLQMVRIETIVSTHPDFLYALTYQINKYRKYECDHGLCHSSGVVQLAADVYYGRVNNDELWNQYKFVVLEQHTDGRHDLATPNLISTLLKDCPAQFETVRFQGPIPFTLGEPFGEKYTREGLFLTGHYSFSCTLEELEAIDRYLPLQSEAPPASALSVDNPLSSSSAAGSASGSATASVSMGVETGVSSSSSFSSPFSTPESADAVLGFLADDSAPLGALRFLPTEALDLGFLAPADALRFSS